MKKREERFTLFLLLLVGFVDYMGIGLVFPLFAVLLFNPDFAIISLEIDEVTRGALLGVLIGLGPAVQFFCSTALGTYSDQKGRRKGLIVGLSFGVVSYLLSVVAVLSKSIVLLMFARTLFGVSAATMAIVQAGIADLSVPSTKSRNFGLLNMAYGAGFTFGPYFAGRFAHSETFAWIGPWTPFAFAAILLIVSLSLVCFRFRDTRPPKPFAKVSWIDGLRRLKVAFTLKEVRVLFLVLFLFLFGWDFFFEFIAVYLMDAYSFSPANIANFYAYCGIWFGLSSGLLIRPVVKKFAPLHILLPALFASGIALFLFLALPSISWLWFYTPVVMFLLALIFPTGTAEISNRVSESMQGEVMGISVSIQALALVLSPLLFGPLVGIYPQSTTIIAGSMAILAALVLLLFSPWKKWERNWKNG